MAMRVDCRHCQTRTYDDGETARFCVLDLAPEQPWRCPDDCHAYERGAIDGTFEQGSLSPTTVEPEPDETADAIADLLDDAETIVSDAEPAVLRDLDRSARRGWWPFGRRRRDGGDDDWRLSSR